MAGASSKTPTGETGRSQSEICMVSTPDDGTCGIGTYTGSLMRALRGTSEDLSLERVRVRLRALDPVHYAAAAIRAGRSDADVVHIQHEYGIYGPKSLTSWVFFPLLSLLARLRGTQVIITLHSAWTDRTISPPLLPLKRLYVRLNNWMLARCGDCFLFLSETCKDQFTESVALDEYEVLPHGVQDEDVDVAASQAKAAFGYAPDDTVVVEPGYVRPEKGHDRFVDVAAELPGYSFLVAGGPQDEADEAFLDRIRDEAPENVQVTGVLDEDRFHAAFRAADLILLPYREVTQSGVFNWCVAHELPVLGSDAPYFRRLADEWGCVELIDPVDVEGTAEAVERVAADEAERRRLVDAMRAYRTESSMESVAESHEAVYRTVATDASA